MDKYVVGGHRLNGVVDISGSKNASTKAMLACLLTKDPCVLRNVPKLGDVEITKSMLSHLGVTVRQDKDSLILQARTLDNNFVPLRYGHLNRISILLLGPLLHRFEKAYVPHPGGCDIGARPIDLHLDFLKAFGARIDQRSGRYYATCRRLEGNKITLSFPSTTVTEHILLTAVLSRGTTTIENAAVNPEVFHLAKMLNSMGAEISVKDNQFTINGVSSLQGLNYEIMPDRNEAVTFAVAALSCGGDVTINNFPTPGLDCFLATLKLIGVSYECSPNSIRFLGCPPYASISVDSAVYPGFESDWLPLMIPLLNQCLGSSVIHETYFENRLLFADQFLKMGMNIRLGRECPAGSTCAFSNRYVHSVRVNGNNKLIGTELTISDLRGGAALVVAALAAEGQSIIRRSEVLDRGYEEFVSKLSRIGANVI